MKKITPRKYAISLYEALKDAEQSAMPGVVKSFIELLASHRVLAQSDKIIKAFKKYLYKQENIQSVEVKTALPLSEHDRREILKHLKNTLNKEIIIKESVDKELVGGIVVKYDDTVIDGSIKSRLKLLADSLK